MTAGKKAQRSAFGTHVDILELILNAKKIDCVFELGPGHYSTELFAGRCKQVISIEQQSDAYAALLKAEFAEYPNVDLRYMPGIPGGPELLAKWEDEIDLVFVDGEALSRALAVNVAFRKTEIIVAHDTDQGQYRWETIKVPRGWFSFEDDKLKPATTVWAKEKKLIEEIKSKLQERRA